MSEYLRHRGRENQPERPPGLVVRLMGVAGKGSASRRGWRIVVGGKNLFPKQRRTGWSIWLR